MCVCVCLCMRARVCLCVFHVRSKHEKYSVNNFYSILAFKLDQQAPPRLSASFASFAAFREGLTVDEGSWTNDSSKVTFRQCDED